MVDITSIDTSEMGGGGGGERSEVGRHLFALA